MSSQHYTKKIGRWASLLWNIHNKIMIETKKQMQIFKVFAKLCRKDGFLNEITKISKKIPCLNEIYRWGSFLMLSLLMK